jgi:hypothetical protein
MPRINTRDAGEYVASLQPFTSNGAIRGDWDDNGAFVVWSYASAIAAIYPNEQRATINAAKYSVTTSKHQHETRNGLAKLGYTIQEETDPAAFEIKTGYRARLRGAGGWN